MKTSYIILAAVLAPVAITLLCVLGAIALVLATFSPILCALWFHHKRSVGGVKPSGGTVKRVPRKGSLKALLVEMTTKPESEWSK